MNGILFLFLLLLIAVAWYYASRRKASDVVSTKPKRLLSFTTPYSPQDALQALVEQSQGGDYTIESVTEENPRLILSTPPSAMTWGFFFPVYLHEQNDGRTLVEVGIQSRLYQMGPLVRRHHERCLAHLQGALPADAATA